VAGHGVEKRVIGRAGVEASLSVGVLARKGELVNATKTEQRLYLWEAGMGFFGADIVGNGIGKRPRPAPGQAAMNDAIRS
jgi:hypothetical protein